MPSEEDRERAREHLEELKRKGFIKHDPEIEKAQQAEVKKLEAKLLQLKKEKEEKEKQQEERLTEAEREAIKLESQKLKEPKPLLFTHDQLLKDRLEHMQQIAEMNRINIERTMQENVSRMYELQKQQILERRFVWLVRDETEVESNEEGFDSSDLKFHGAFTTEYEAHKFASLMYPHNGALVVIKVPIVLIGTQPIEMKVYELNILTDTMIQRGNFFTHNTEGMTKINLSLKKLKKGDIRDIFHIERSRIVMPVTDTETIENFRKEVQKNIKENNLKFKQAGSSYYIT